MALTATVTPAKTLVGTERVTNSKLNQGFAPTVTLSGTADTSQITDDAVTAAKAAFGAWFYCSASGTNTITLTASGHTITLVEGMIARFKVATDNTGAVDITFGGSTKDLFRYYNSTTAAGVELAAGDLRAGQNCEVIYDGTRWQLLSALGSSQVVVGIDAGSTDAYAITPTPSVRAYSDLTGVPVVFKANTINSGAATLQVSGLGSAKTIVKSYNQTLGDGDIKAGQWVTVVYDGTNFQLQSPVSSSPPVSPVRFGSGLTVARASASTLTVTASELVLKSSAGTAVLVSGLSVTADLAAAGGGANVNCRESGIAEDASAFYYLWVISDGTTGATLLNKSDTTISTFPTNYSYKALLGVCYNDGFSNITSVGTYRGASVEYVSDDLSTSTSAQTLTVPHPFGAVPLAARVAMVCASADAATGYGQGAVLAPELFYGTNYQPGILDYADVTNLYVQQAFAVNSSAMYVNHASTYVATVVATAKWTMRLVATFKA